MSIHWKILIGIILGLVIGYIASLSDFGIRVIQDFIKPFGTIFIKSLKLIAVPLVFVSLAKGIAELKDIKKLSSLGGKTIVWYLVTTVFAVFLGLLLVNVFQPGAGLDIEALQRLATDTINLDNKKTSGTSPLDFFVRMVPDNIFSALGNNGQLLQVIFFTVLNVTFQTFFVSSYLCTIYSYVHYRGILSINVTRSTCKKLPPS